MADVTGGTPPTNASPFAVPADMEAIYDHFGDQANFSVANAAALPSSGNWVGRTAHIEDIDVLAQVVALPGTWKRWYPVHAQEQGVVTCPGTGDALGDIGWSDLITVTFTAGRFSVAPHVKVQTIGPNDQIQLGGVVEQVTSSGCKVRGIRVGSVPSNLFSVQWTAVQMLSGAAVG